jgi:heme exporter protein A
MGDGQPGPHICARSISARRGGRLVIEGITLTVEPGQIYVLRGENGAGKSTLLRTLAGLSPIASGSIDRSEAATVFLGHADGVKGALSARENISFWRALYSAGAESAAQATNALQVAPFIDQPAATLSAGQRRRLALCRIAISGRPIWLLDEPTSGMDAASIAAVIRLIAGHCGNSGAAIVATHEPLRFENAITITLTAPEPS